MKIQTISFTKTLQTDAYTWRKVGIQAEVEEKDTPEQSIKELESIVDGYLAEIVGETVKEVKVVESLTKDTVEQATIKAMQGCTDIKVLKTFAKLAENYPKVKEEYFKILQKITAI